MQFDPATSGGLTSNLDSLGHQWDVEEGRGRSIAPGAPQPPLAVPWVIERPTPPRLKALGVCEHQSEAELRSSRHTSSQARLEVNICPVHTLTQSYTWSCGRALKSKDKAKESEQLCLTMSRTWQ